MKGETVESKLCQKCQETLGLYSNSATYIHSWWHCHHEEPEEKPKEKCWCEQENHKKILYGCDESGKHPKAWDVLFCPVCAKKL